MSRTLRLVRKVNLAKTTICKSLEKDSETDEGRQERESDVKILFLVIKIEK